LTVRPFWNDEQIVDVGQKRQCRSRYSAAAHEPSDHREFDFALTEIGNLIKFSAAGAIGHEPVIASAAGQNVGGVGGQYIRFPIVQYGCGIEDPGAVQSAAALEVGDVLGVRAVGPAPL